LELQSLTDSGRAGSEPIDSMCAAVYETANPGDPFLSVALIRFSADDAAEARYDLIKGGFVTQGVAISEVDNAAEGLLDRVSAPIDSGGIGRMTVLHQKNWA
jgi:hypothetical protein